MDHAEVERIVAELIPNPVRLLPTDACVSFDADAVGRLGSAGFTLHLEAGTPETLRATLSLFRERKNPQNTVKVSTALYDMDGGRVPEGLFLYFRQETQSLYGVYVESPLNHPEN